MSLTLVSEPPRWQAAHLPIEFEFDYVLEAESASEIGSYLTQAFEGLLAIPKTLAIGEYYFIGKLTDKTLWVDYPLKVKSRTLVGLAEYSVFDFAYDPAIVSLRLFSLDYIASVQPRFSLNINGTSIELDPQMYAGGKIVIPVDFFLRFAFQNHQPPEVAPNNSIPYALHYGTGEALQHSETKFVTDAVVHPENPACSNNTPIWQEINLQYCEKVEGVNTGKVFVDERDVNPYSPTYNTERARFLGINTGLCPLPLFLSEERTGEFTRNNCPTDYTGQTVSFTMPAGAYSSTESQAKANEFRDMNFNSSGQIFANSTGTCTPPIPTETGTISIERAECQRPNNFGRPMMVKVKALRASQNGSSALVCYVRIYRYSVDSDTFEPMPNLSYAPTVNCDTTQTTMGLVDGSTYYAKIEGTSNSNYVITDGFTSVNFVNDFSSDMDCV